jgi:hypothetical protein
MAVFALVSVMFWGLGDVIVMMFLSFVSLSLSHRSSPPLSKILSLWRNFTHTGVAKELNRINVSISVFKTNAFMALKIA